MPPLLTVTGRDVLFAHWPVDPAEVRRLLPDALAVETFDGSAWVSVLALENPAVAPGSGTVPPPPGRGFPQLNFRTYASAGGTSGVYFLSLDSGRRLPASVGRFAFGLPFHRARMRMTRRGEAVTVRSRRTGSDPPAAFGARYRPTGETYRAAAGSLEAFCVERTRYLLPASEDARAPVAGTTGVRVGTVERAPWDLRPAEASIRYNTLFEAAGLPAPESDPVVAYSPGFEMTVRPTETPPEPGTDDTSAG
jgi:uncharacterized protein YqjF (DUF2071 family)